MKKRIGITGGTGFIGQYLIRGFGDQYEFVAVTSHNDCSRFCSKAKYIHAPYDKNGYSRAFDGCSTVVHLGASIPQQVTEIGLMDSYINNITSSEELLLACKELGVKKFINISSVSVYNKNNQLPLVETMNRAPDNCYGITKATVEMLADMYGKAYGFSAITLRVSQVLGYIKGKNNGFFSMLLNNACQGKDITIFGQGKAARDYVYVKDVVRAIILAIEADAPSGAYNIGAGYPTTNTELAEAYINGINSNSKISHINVDKEDSRYWFMDISKAQHLLGYFPAFTPTDMARDMKNELKMANEC